MYSVQHVTILERIQMAIFVCLRANKRMTELLNSLWHSVN